MIKYVGDFFLLPFSRSSINQSRHDCKIDLLFARNSPDFTATVAIRLFAALVALLALIMQNTRRRFTKTGVAVAAARIAVRGNRRSGGRRGRGHRGRDVIAVING